MLRSIVWYVLYLVYIFVHTYPGTNNNATMLTAKVQLESG